MSVVVVTHRVPDKLRSLYAMPDTQGIWSQIMLKNTAARPYAVTQSQQSAPLAFHDMLNRSTKALHKCNDLSKHDTSV